MNKNHLVWGVTLGIAFGIGSFAWYIMDLRDENKNLRKEYATQKSPPPQTAEITKIKQEYEKALDDYKNKFDALQKRVQETDTLAEATKRAHAADKEKVTALERKVKDALIEVEQYKKKKEEEKASPSVTDLVYERVNNQYTSLSFVMHHLDPEQITVLEATLDHALRKLNKKRTEKMLIYHNALTDPEYVSHGPWIKAEIWEEDKGYGVRIATSLPGNKEVKLIEILERNCAGLPFSNLRNSLK